MDDGQTSSSLNPPAHQPLADFFGVSLAEEHRFFGDSLGRKARIKAALEKLDTFADDLIQCSLAEVQERLADVARAVVANSAAEVRSLIELGSALNALKHQVPHGSFIKEAQRFTPGISHSTRNNAMAVARVWRERRDLRLSIYTAGDVNSMVRLARQHCKESQQPGPVTASSSRPRGLLALFHVLAQQDPASHGFAALALPHLADLLGVLQEHATAPGATDGDLRRAAQLTRLLGTDDLNALRTPLPGSTVETPRIGRRTSRHSSDLASPAAA